MKINDNSREYREKINLRDEEYEDYARNGGCVALMFAAILVVMLMLVFLIMLIL